MKREKEKEGTRSWLSTKQRRKKSGVSGPAYKLEERGARTREMGTKGSVPARNRGGRRRGYVERDREGGRRGGEIVGERIGMCA